MNHSDEKLLALIALLSDDQRSVVLSVLETVVSASPGEQQALLAGLGSKLAAQEAAATEAP